MNLRSFAIVALCFLPSCGGSDPKTLIDDGSKALNSGDYRAAASSFDEALAALDASSPEWLRAKLGGIQARTQIDGVKAMDEFLQLAKASPGKVTAEHFNLIGSRLGDASKLTEATKVLEVGMEMHPESPHLKALLAELGKKAEASGDPEALKNLKSLGYIGD